MWSKEYRIKWMEKNLERRKKWNRDYINKNKVRISNNRKIWRLKNKDKINQYNNKDSGLFRTYLSMINRCNSKTCTSYKWYGGKGIKCLWTSYNDFKTDMYESYIEHLNKYGRKNTSLDRIDNDNGYFKENCRWATTKEQGMNRSNKNIFRDKYNFEDSSEWFKYSQINKLQNNI